MWLCVFVCVFLYCEAFHAEYCLFPYAYIFSVLFSIVISSLGEERAGLFAFRVFVCLFCRRYCVFLFLPLGVMVWLRLVIVTLPGRLFQRKSKYLVMCINTEILC